MQAASSRTHQSSYLPFLAEGRTLLLSNLLIHSPKGYFTEREEQGATELVLVALLLLRLPLLLIKANEAEEVAQGDLNHQFTAGNCPVEYNL